MLFTSDLIKLAWQIKRQFNMAWGDALRLAIKVCNLPAEGVQSRHSVFGEWKPAATDAVAGHFWGLSKAYEELHDTGRAIAMRKIAKTFYTMNDLGDTVVFADLLKMKFFGESVLQEILDFFVASAETWGRTARSADLITKGAFCYAACLKPARWAF